MTPAPFKLEPVSGDCAACVDDPGSPLCLICSALGEPELETQECLDLGLYDAATREQLGLDLGIWRDDK